MRAMIVAVVRAWTTPPASNVSAMSAMATVATVTGIGAAASAGVVFAPLEQAAASDEASDGHDDGDAARRQ